MQNLSPSQAMTIEEQFATAISEFNSQGCRLQLSKDGTAVTATTSHDAVTYIIPPRLQGNLGRIPGWFLAGIWYEMGLPEGNSNFNVSYYLSGWGFTMPDVSRVWLKTLPSDNSKVLIYHFGQFYISDLESNWQQPNRLPERKDLVADCPRESIYHVIKLFEEKGWFDYPESKVLSQAVSEYRK